MHTPGPWLTKPGDTVINVYASADHGGDRIADVGCQPYWKKFTKTDMANAHLISAAPDLLQELRTSHCPGGDWNGMPERLEGIATVQDCLNAGVCGCSAGAVIKKAEGR